MVTNVVIGVAVLALLIYRQLRTRPVNASGLRLAAIIGVIGLVEAYAFVEKHHVGAVTYAALLGSLALAAVFGVLRATTVRIWLQDGQPWSRGSWVTASLWIVALAAPPGLRRPGRGARHRQRGRGHHPSLPRGEPRYPAAGRAPAGPAPADGPAPQSGSVQNPDALSTGP